MQAKNGSKDSCETFYFAGANTYYLVRLMKPADSVYPRPCPSCVLPALSGPCKDAAACLWEGAEAC